MFCVRSSIFDHRSSLFNSRSSILTRLSSIPVPQCSTLAFHGAANFIQEREGDRQPDLAHLPPFEQRHSAVEVFSREGEQLLIQIGSDVGEFARVQTNPPVHSV